MRRFTSAPSPVPRLLATVLIMSSEKGKAWKKGIYVEKLIINCSVGESGDSAGLPSCSDAESTSLIASCGMAPSVACLPTSGGRRLS